jgi:hypothetical protein
VADTCGICIDEFHQADETNEDNYVAETPQCNHHFHKSCLMQWCQTKINKLQKPDCPSCRVLFEPEKIEKPNVEDQADEPIPVNIL